MNINIHPVVDAGEKKDLIVFQAEHYDANVLQVLLRSKLKVRLHLIMPVDVLNAGSHPVPYFL